MSVLLISKRKDAKIAKDDYKIGWLIQDEDKGYWAIWGSAKNKECALNVVKDTFKFKKKQYDVFMSDEPLTENLTKEEISKLRKLSIKEICQ